MRGVEMKTCPECNVQFECGGNCWCNAYPPIMSVTPNRGCYCQKCLHEVMVNKVNEFMNNLTPEAEEMVKALGPVKTPMIDIDYTLNEQGEKQFTTWYQLRNQSVTKS